MNFYVFSEIAEKLRISESLVYALIESGKITPHRFGNGRGKILVSEKDLQAYVEASRK